MATYWVVERKSYTGWGRTYCIQLFMTPLAADAAVTQTYRLNPAHFEAFPMRVRPATWQEREETWMCRGDYVAPVWRSENWWETSTPRRDHYAHISLEDTTMLAYTASDADGERDRQTRVKPGRYLTKYFADVLTPKQIAYYAEWWVKGVRPSENVEVQFASTPEDIARVYTQCAARSCMDNTHGSRFTDPEHHPARVYGAGDLSLAYVNGPDGVPVSRALCWPEKKAFFRVYPTPGEGSGGGDNLWTQLKAMGWEDIYANTALFEGARLLQIRNADAEWVMPYLDLSYGVKRGTGEQSDFWIMTREGYDYKCDMQDGTLTGGDEDEDEDDYEDSTMCEDCENRIYYNNEVTYYEEVVAHGPRVFARHERTVCQDCRTENSFFCDGVEENIADTVGSVEVGFNQYSRPWFDMHGYYCAFDGCGYLTGDDEPVPMSGEHDGETWAERNIADNAYAIEGDDGVTRYYANDDTTPALLAAAIFQNAPDYDVVAYVDNFNVVQLRAA